MGEPPPPAREGPPGTDDRDAGTLTVLVVEDDAATAELLRVVLNDVPGLGAVVVHDPAAAREVGRHVRLDAVVLNLHLPGISGPELLAQWRAAPDRPSPPAVLLTADPAHPEARAAVEAGRVAALVRKPFDLDDLVATVARHTGSTRDEASPGPDR